MLLYNKGRFYLMGASFALPQGFYLDTGSEPGFKDYLYFHSPDLTYSLRYELFAGRKSIAEQSKIEPEGSTSIAPTKIVDVNGLQGFTRIYDVGLAQYFEMCVELIPPHENIDNAVHLRFTAETRYKDILKITSSAKFNKIISSFRKEEE